MFLRKKNLSKIIKGIVSVLLITVLSNNTRAQETYDLSRCVLIGLERNFSLKIARNDEQILENNNTKGNAGFLPIVTTTNRFGGTLNSTTQNMNDGSENNTKGVYNTTGSAAINASMTLFRGFDVQTTWQKLNELKQMGELNTQMTMENLVSQIIAEYYYYIEQINFKEVPV